MEALKWETAGTNMRGLSRETLKKNVTLEVQTTEFYP